MTQHTLSTLFGKLTFQKEEPKLYFSSIAFIPSGNCVSDTRNHVNSSLLKTEGFDWLSGHGV